MSIPWDKLIEEDEDDSEYADYHQPAVRVYCSNCDERFDEEKVEATGIAEDDLGRDRLSFICPKCGTDQESFRYS